MFDERAEPRDEVDSMAASLELRGPQAQGPRSPTYLLLALW